MLSNQFITNVTDHLVIHWGVCLLLIVLDDFLYRSGLWRDYKLHDRKIPDSPSNILKTVLKNQFFVTFPLMFLTEFFYGTVEEGDFLTWRNLYRIPLVFLFEEIFFYYSHAFLHLPYFYKRVHKIHHRWTAPMAISATYAHPFEHLLSNVLPLFFSARLAGLNYTTMRIWYVTALINTLLIAHGGYALNNFHDLHHVYFNCNYGVLGILDRFHGTLQG